jgi:signal transduction histidine kinase
MISVTEAVNNGIIHGNKADPEKIVELECTCNDERVEFVIRDEGDGIHPEALPRIREPFFTTKQDSGGIGLGLSISSKIVEEHRGTLRFASAPGAGTTVTITLPADTGPTS